jgi:2-dehydro-3-deoxyglucarate aldolase
MSKLKQKLENNELTVGSWITIGHHSIIEIMSSAGFDWLTIDMEHSAIELTEAQNLIAHIQANKMDALVRVGKNEEVVIKRVLDAGANGIIVPMVNSKNDAIKAVEYVKYPPQGKRGVGLARAQKYGIGFEEYKERLENEVVIIAQVEHIDSVNNLEEILGVEGIDGIIIGPYDLSGSMGKPGKFNDDNVKAAIKRVESICKGLNKPMGFHVISPDYKELNKKILDGYKFLAFSLDFLFLGEKARIEMSNIKK